MLLIIRMENKWLCTFPLHGGTFLRSNPTVNNKHAEALEGFGKHSIDAIGINSKVAERLSGADFDVIP